jgi:hypothetical protein
MISVIKALEWVLVILLNLSGRDQQSLDVVFQECTLCVDIAMRQVTCKVPLSKMFSLKVLLPVQPNVIINRDNLTLHLMILQQMILPLKLTHALMMTLLATASGGLQAVNAKQTPATCLTCARNHANNVSNRNKMTLHLMLILVQVNQILEKHNRMILRMRLRIDLILTTIKKMLMTSNI